MKLYTNNWKVTLQKFFANQLRYLRNVKKYGKIGPISGGKPEPETLRDAFPTFHGPADGRCFFQVMHMVIPKCLVECVHRKFALGDALYIFYIFFHICFIKQQDLDVQLFPCSIFKNNVNSLKPLPNQVQNPW